MYYTYVYMRERHLCVYIYACIYIYIHLYIFIRSHFGSSAIFAQASCRQGVLLKLAASPHQLALDIPASWCLNVKHAPV